MMGVMAERLAVKAPPELRTADFDSWMRSEQRRVFLISLRILGEADEADSVTQDVFFKAYRALSDPDASPVADRSRWVARIAVNACLDRLRSRTWKFWKRRPPAEDEQIILSMTPSSGTRPEDTLYGEQIARRLHTALDKLSARQRAVFTLRHYEDMSLEEIAGTLGLDVGTVKAHMSRALAKMREELKDLYQGTCHHE